MATFNGSSRADGIKGTKNDDIINGLGGDDELVGLDGNDTIDGGIGADHMTGGTGDDTYYVDQAFDVVIEGKSEGDDTVRSSISYTLPSNVERLELQEGSPAVYGNGNSQDNTIRGNSNDNSLKGSGGDDYLAGRVGDDFLLGGSGDDRLDGGSDNDTMFGGTGDDLYAVEQAGDIVGEYANEGVDEVYATIDYTLGANVENLWLFPGALNGTGNALDNRIIGNNDINVLDGGAGNDTLYGNTGFSSEADTLIGGTGDDTFYVMGAGPIVVEHSNGGTDRIVSIFSYVLPWNVENLEFQHPSMGVDGTGNNLDNAIRGTDGINVLSGQWGDDDLYGYAGADVLVGGSDDDTLDGGTGADVMVGGTGNDGYLVDDAGDVVTENANEGTDFVDSWVAYVLGTHVENLDLRGDADIDGTGNDLDNFIGGNAGINVLTGGGGNDTFDGEGGNDTIYGGEGNDSIDGGLGADMMAGGLGDDLYYLIDAGNTIVENANEGTDTVESRVTHTLAANVENLTLSRFGGAINGTGNSLVNLITGNDDANVLSGMAGDDTLIGGAGVDLLTGGGGVDRFQLNLPTEGADVIADFVNGTDRFWIDDAGFGLAGTGTLAANGVAFVLGSAATSASATLVFNAATHQVLWDADGTGAGSAQLLATLIGMNAMSASDFLIV